jgi:Sortase domain
MEYFKKHQYQVKIYGFAVGFYLFVASLFLYPLMHQHAVAHNVQHQLTTIQAQTTAAPITETISGEPQTFQIKRLGIDFPVAPGMFDVVNKSWTLDSQHVFVNTLDNANPTLSTSTTAQPRIVTFYAHNFSNVVGNTKNLVAGDILTITTDTNYTFRYYYVHDQVVGPNDAQILQAPNQDLPVALITCTGTWDQSRRIMYFAPLGTPQLNQPLTTASTL